MPNSMYIKVREYRRGNQKGTIQRNWQHMVQKTKKNKAKHNTICVGHHYAQADTNSVNKVFFQLYVQNLNVGKTYEFHICYKIIL